MVDSVNITDNQTAMVRMSSWAASLIAIEEGLEPNYQMVCRDRNRLAMQADILGASALGIRNLLCLSGDHMQFGDHPQAKGVFDIDSIQLIGMVKKMRDEGKFLSGADMNGRRRFLLVRRPTPLPNPLTGGSTGLPKRLRPGRTSFRPSASSTWIRCGSWVRRANDMGLTEKIFILAGVTPMKSIGMARYMKLNVPGMDVPDEIIKRLQGVEKKKVADEGINIACEQIAEFKEMKGDRRCSPDGHRVGTQGSGNRRAGGDAAPAGSGPYSWIRLSGRKACTNIRSFK